MKTLKSATRRRVFMLAAIIVASGCLRPVGLSIFADAAVAAGEQKAAPPSKSRGDEDQQKSERVSRPRRVSDDRSKDDKSKDDDRRVSSDGPLIRIGLMIDVASVALSSASGLVVYRSLQSSGDGQEIASGQLRVEARKQTNTVAAYKSAYRVEVASASDTSRARKVADDLKKKFFEQSSTTYDSREKKYLVSIGEFSAKSKATEMVERLRRAGYADARIVAAREDLKPERNARLDRSDEKEAQKLFVVALESGRPVISGAEMLVIKAADDEKPTERRDDQARGKKISTREDAPMKRDSEKASSRDAAVRVGDADYRGEIQLMLNSRGRLNVINVLPLEQYLKGVVPRELSPIQFPEIEALKAQAIAARSYALAHLGQYRNEGFDLRDDARSQVYGGLSAEHPVTNRAVEETRGVVALYLSEEGRYEPIDALYTSTCGGRTENNEAIFLGKAAPYLRSVDCAADRQIAVSREISSAALIEPLVGMEGRAIAREVALLDALGFAMPRRVTAQYLRGLAVEDELRNWIERAARLTQASKPEISREGVTRLPEFASIVAAAVYGEGRASLLMSPADIDYLLAGVGADDAPQQTRGDLAMLLKDGVLRPPAGGRSLARADITRGYAIEILARALFAGQRPAQIVAASRSSNPRSAISDQSLKLRARLYQATAGPAENGRLIIASSGSTASGKSSRDDATTGFEIAKDARLFRLLGGESYCVNRLTLLGGERIAFHLDSEGRIDFLEAEPTANGAASDRFSSVARWQERVSAQELQRRLARARVNVGEVKDLIAVQYGASGRVLTMEVIGDKGRSQMRGYQIRNALGLKENLFVIERERDERNQNVAFIFTGRGWGHGVGLCQTGAYGLAKEGYSHTAILQKYYTGARVQKIY